MDKQNNGVELENKGAVRQAEVDRKQTRPISNWPLM